MQRERAERRVALLLEYDGTAYGGSQYQANAPTVQGALERALGSLTGEPIRIAMAGRTDAGVHALGQVASFATTAKHREATIVRALNALLPADISVRAARDVPSGFNPRRGAVSRRYRYTLHLGAVRPALLRRTTWHPGRELNVQAMQEAAKALVGTYDFAAFAPPSEARKRSTVRDLTLARLTACREILYFDVEANAFLAHMVRRIVGVLVEVGSGRMTVAEFGELVNVPVPGKASRTAPSRGLCLVKVRYESGLFNEEDEYIQP
jgi:tRNA pseudouridine38-40 synthase